MAVEMVLLMVLVSVSLVNSQDAIRVDCPPAVGVVGGTTEISCSFRKRFPDQRINVTAVTVTRRDTGPVFWIKDGEKGNRGDRGDTRFNLPSREDPSLQITNTALSDEGLYDYLVVTDRGATSGTFWISVTGASDLLCLDRTGVIVTGCMLTIVVIIIMGLLYLRRCFQRCVPACPTETDPDPAETDILKAPGSVPDEQTDPHAAETDNLHPPGNSSGEAEMRTLNSSPS